MEHNNHIHVFHSTVVPATCKENGYTLHKCECGYFHKDSFVQKGCHNYEIVEETKPTCTEIGNRMYRCTVCNEEKNEQITPVGHLWEDWNIQKFPTCTEQGLKTRRCSKCGFTEDQNIAETGHKLTTPKKSEKQSGYVDYFCENCGETITVPTFLQKAKNQLKTHKKAVLIFAIIAISAFGLFLTTELFSPYYHYSRATSLIEAEDYNEAYLHLIKCKKTQKTKDILKNFKPVYNEVSIKHFVGNGDDALLWERIHKYEYDQYGNNIREIISHEGSNVVNYFTKYDYDKHGNIIHEVEYDGDGDVLYSTEYKYDKYGNIILEIEYDGAGAIRYYTEYEYDKYGNIIREIRYYEGSTVRNYTEYEYEYDKYGNIIHEIEYDGDEDVRYSNEYKYDKYGNIIRQIEYNGAGDVLRSNEYKYDKYGNVKFKVVYDDHGRIYHKFEYDKYGNIISKLQYYEGGDSYPEYKYEYTNPRVIFKQNNK